MKISDLYDGSPRLCRWCGEDYGEHGCCGDEDRPCELESYDEAQERAWVYGPAMEAAIRIGCTCRYPVASPYDADPPEVIRDKHCRLHGSEPDEDHFRERKDAA